MGLSVKIIEKIETTRSNIIKVCDGTKNFDLFVRNLSSFEKIKLDSFYDIEYNQNNLKSIKPSRANDYDEKIQNKIKYTDEFVYDHSGLKKLNSRYKKLFLVLMKAIVEGRTIFIRHDNDCDGVSSGVMLEIACKSIKEKFDLDGTQKIFRNPMMQPYYSFDDAFFDLNSLKSETKPLFVVLDHGGTRQDYLGIKSLKLNHCQVCVIDHHDHGGDDIIDEIADAVINPHLEGEGSELCAGILTYELIKKMGENNLDHVPAMAALADKSPMEMVEFYNKFSIDELEIYAHGINLMTGISKSSAAPKFYLDFFQRPKKYLDYLKLIFDEKTKQDNIFLKQVENLIEKHKNVILFDSTINLAKKSKMLGGSAARIILDNYGDENTVVICKNAWGLTFRIGEKSSFSVIDFLTKIKKQFSNYTFYGGGHPKAGSIDVPSAIVDDVLEYLYSIV